MFELHITCTKDISKLNIDFTDGTCLCTETPGVPRVPEKLDESDEPDTNVDWEQYNKKVSSEVIEKPVVPELNRQPKIDDVLNNLEI